MNNYSTHKDKIIAKLIRKYSKNKKESLLDVGAGNKPFKEKLPRSIKYFSLDLDKKRNPDIVADIEKKLPIKDKEYDFVVCTEVLEHTLYPKNIIKELKRITKKPGFLIISMPNEYNFYLRLKFLLGVQNNTEVPFRDNLWKNHIHRARVKDLLKFYYKNFDVLKVEYSWDSFSNKKLLQFIDKFIHNLMKGLSKNLFSRSVIIIAKNS